MTARGKVWAAGGALAALVLGGFAAAEWWLHPRLDSHAAPAVVLVLIVLGSLILTACAAIWVWLDVALLRPLRTAVRGLRIITHSSPAHSLEVTRGHLIDDLPEAVHALAKELQQAKHEVARALGSGAKEAEEQKSRLEAVLQDLDEGVIVCEAQARIALYNTAARDILRDDPALGLGRSLYGIIAKAPLEHGLEVLRHVRESERNESPHGTEFVCTAANGDIMLRCRLRLLAPEHRVRSGFVITFDDITRQIEALSQRDDLLREVLDDMRPPVANMRAAIETLASHHDIDLEKRRRFEEVILDETTHLSEMINRLGEQSRALVGSEWLMGDVYSADLVGGLKRRLDEPDDPTVTMTGVPLWLHGDSYALTLLLTQLLRRLRWHTGVENYDVESLLGDRRVYLDLVWKGQPVSESALTTWLSEPLLHAVGALTVSDVVDIHGGHLWSQRHRRPGLALLRLPVPLSRRQWEGPPLRLPARPEFYDFALPSAPRELGERGKRSLEDLEYVVFDTETTGLRPSLGDEIVQIAGVRIVNGRILTGETFERLVNPRRKIPKRSVRFHGITDEMIQDKPPIEVVLPQFQRFVGDAVLVAHNGAFDMRFLQLKEKAAGCHFDNPLLDTLLLSVYLHDHAEDHTLDGIAERLGVETIGRHTALGDSLSTAEVFLRMLDLLAERGVVSLQQTLDVSDRIVSIRKQQAEF